MTIQFTICRRLKPGGGGVNAAIFNAAGSILEVATKEQAKSLVPGSAVVVPLPSTSPLYSREGVTHVIHVLGPNMNPHRPNPLDGDYDKGCQILRKAYSALFEGFMSIVKSQARLPHDAEPKTHYSTGNQKSKRDDVHEHEITKKSRGLQNEVGRPGKVNTENDKPQVSTGKTWGSWAQALYHMAMHPERHKDDLLEISDDFVVLNDLYPKVCASHHQIFLYAQNYIIYTFLWQAEKHLLVLSRYDGLDGLADVRREHLQLLEAMHAVGLKWAKKFWDEDPSLEFRLGYHSVNYIIFQ